MYLVHSILLALPFLAIFSQDFGYGKDNPHQTLQILQLVQ